MKSVIIIAIAFVLLFVPVNAYATHVDDEDYSDEILDKEKIQCNISD